jgi:outer membrane protein assembly factor BamB
MFGTSSRLGAALTTIVALAVALGATAATAAGEGNITTAGYSALRDNWDPSEPGLSPSVVQSKSFGQIFSTKVKGSVYAQPLIYNGDAIVTTEEARAYAINASTGAIVWERSFGNAVKGKTIECGDLLPNEGSTSTSVIDPSTGTIYLTTHLLEGGKKLADADWKLQAISAATGEEEPGYPLPIEGTPANTPGIPFNASHQQQRPGLLLLNGVVYMAFGSDCDITPYRGIVIGVSTTTHKIVTMWSDEAGVGTDENSQAGIWQSGGGLVSTASNQIILATGNGVSPEPAASGSPPETLSESVIGLGVEPNGTLKPKQFFAPSDAPELDANDEDLGSGGPIALPTEYFGTKSIPRLLVEVGKDGRVFLINQENMGGYRQGPGASDAVLQELGPFEGVWGHPAAYGGQGGWVYVLESAGGGYLRALSYGLNGEGKPALGVAGTSSESFGYTSGSPLVTSNGTTEGSAVVWVVYSRGTTEAEAELGHGGQLRAYAAMPTGGNLPLLWSAKIGVASKFATPTAYGGRVYVGTRNGRLIAYGASESAPVQAAPVNLGSVPVGQSATAMLEISAARKLSLTGPITVEKSSDQGVAGPWEAFGPSPTSKGKDLKTAGPSKIPPSGTTPIPAGVLSIDQPHTGAAIAAGATLRLPVHFKPAHAGPIVGELSIRTSAGTRTVTVSGYGTAPGLLVSAQPIAFHEVSTGVGGKALTVTFSNSSTEPETITGFELPKGPYMVSGLPTVGSVLAPRQAVTVLVRFDPAHAGSYRSYFEITTDHGSVKLPATGTAVTGYARLTPSAKTIDFGAVAVGRAKSKSFTIGNTGTIPLTITRSLPPVGAFSTTRAIPEGITFEAGIVVHQTIAFRPTATGRFSGEYRFNSNDDQGYVTVRFEGIGVRRR